MAVDYLLFASFIFAVALKFCAVIDMTALGALFNFRPNGQLVFRELQPAN